MKIDFEEKIVPISSLPVGSCFFAERTKGKGKGLYLKIDKNNGMIYSVHKFSSQDFAVNLESGQIRPFVSSFEVEPVEAKVSIIK